jgi:hypothetical protein
MELCEKEKQKDRNSVKKFPEILKQVTYKNCYEIDVDWIKP